METKELIKTIVNEIDPIDLISCGAPTDEYQHEIDLMVELVESYKEKPKLEKLTTDITDVFLSQFNSLNITQEKNIKKISKKMKTLIKSL